MFSVNESLGYLLAMAAKKTSARFTQLMQEQGIDIGHSGWIVLSRLWEEDGLSQQEISGPVRRGKTQYINVLR
jgi:hypothetical protein